MSETINIQWGNIGFKVRTQSGRRFLVVWAPGRYIAKRTSDRKVAERLVAKDPARYVLVDRSAR